MESSLVLYVGTEEFHGSNAARSASQRAISFLSEVKRMLTSDSCEINKKYE